MLTLGNNHSHSNNLPLGGQQNGTGVAEKAAAGMPGILGLELGRSGKTFSQRQVWFVQRETRGNVKHVTAYHPVDFLSFLYCISLSCVSPLALVQNSLPGLW